MPSVRFSPATTLERQWGEEIVVALTDTHAGKILKRKAGTKGGFQCHVKEESHYLLSGRLLIRTKDATSSTVETTVEAGSCWTVPPLTLHQEEALTDCVIFEVSDPTRNDRYAIEPDPGGLPSMSSDDAVLILRGLASAARKKAALCDHMATQIRHRGSIERVIGA